MLKQLRVNLMLEKAKRSLADLLGQRKCFEERKADIEKRFADAGATPDADMEAIENDLSALEKEVEEADIDKKISDTEAEIERLEKELSEIGKQTPSGESGGETSEPEPHNNKGAENMERKSSARKYELRKRLAPFVERDNVKKWLSDIRALGKGESRAVTGAELNIPTEVLEPIREKIEEYSKLIKYVNFKPVKGKARQPIIATVPEAIWTEMKGVLNELELVFNVMEVDGYKVAGFVPVPNYILNDSDINLLVEITDIIGKSLGRGLDKAIVYGNGKKTLLGIVPRLAATTAPRDFGDGAPDFTDLSKSHIGKLSSATLSAEAFFSEVVLGLGAADSEFGDDDTKFWCMNARTYSKLMAKLVNFNAAGAITTGISGKMPVVGGSIEKLGFMPDNVIAGGYGNLYLLVEREGGTVTKSEHAMFIQDNTVFKGTGRYDGGPAIGEGFSMFTIDTTDGATSVEFAEDTANADTAAASVDEEDE